MSARQPPPQRPAALGRQRDRDQTDAQGQRHAVRRPVQDDKATNADRSIARILGNVNQVEASLATFAEGRSQLKVINRFAQRQADEHEEFVRQLRRFAADAGSGIGNSEDSNEQATNDSGNSQSAELDMRKVGRELANENYRAAKKELREHQGLDFDWAFVSQQKMIHDALSADVTVLRRYASSSLREVLDEQLARVKQDQQMLDQLVDRLKEEEQNERNSSSRQYSESDRRFSQGSQKSRRDSSSGNYLDEFQFSEADFIAKVSLATDQNGRPSLGIRIDRNQSDRVAIASVRPDGPAAKAGLQPGDVILAVDGRAVSSPDDLVQAVSRAKAGSELQLLVDRSKYRQARIPLGGADTSRGGNDRQQSDGSDRNDHEHNDNRNER